MKKKKKKNQKKNKKREGRFKIPESQKMLNRAGQVKIRTRIQKHQKMYNYF